MLAQLDRDEALAKGYWNLAMIVLVGLLAVLFLVAIFVIRRWKHRQLKAIDKDRQARRAGQSAERVDAWAASSERYVDHDKLPPDDDTFTRDRDDEDTRPDSTDGMQESDEEERDPYGLFSDKPYQDPDDEDDLDDDEDDEDWDADDGPEDKL